MRTILVRLIAAIALTATAHPAAWADPAHDPTPHAEDAPVAEEPVPFGFDIVPYLGTSSDGGARRRIVSLNLLGGLSGGIDALELGAGFNIDRGRVSGLQLAGAFNLVDADLHGVQGAGGMNVTLGDARGAQLAPLNVLGGQLRGAQLGTLNVVAGGVSGAQIGTLNVAARPVEGLQLGVVNMAPSADVGIGVLGIYWDGWSDGEVLANESGMLLGGIRHGSGATYNVYYIGGRLGDGTSDFVAGLGLGARTMLAPSLELAFDLTNLWVANEDNYDRLQIVTALRPHLSWRPHARVALYAGPTLNVEVVDAEIASEVDPLLGAWRVSEDGDEYNVRLWLGFITGMRIF